jgi:hypothetical protein
MRRNFTRCDSVGPVSKVFYRQAFQQVGGKPCHAVSCLT